MKLMRILFYQTYYYLKRPHIFLRYKEATFENACDFIFVILLRLSIMLWLVVWWQFVLHPIVSVSVRRNVLVGLAIFLCGVAVTSILLYLGYKRQIRNHDRNLQIIEDSSYDTPRNRRIFYAFYYGGNVLFFLMLIYLMLPHAYLNF